MKTLYDKSGRPQMTKDEWLRELVTNTIHTGLSNAAWINKKEKLKRKSKDSMPTDFVSWLTIRRELPNAPVVVKDILNFFQ